MKIKSFTDLEAWKEAHKLVLSIYKIVKDFPRIEGNALADQMRRCSVSVSSNIAEGFSRQTKKEKIQFYFMAKGSLTELQNQLLIAKDIEYMKRENFDKCANQTVIVSKLITGILKSAESRNKY